MATRILGLDIQEDMLCAVVVEQRGPERIVHACASLKVGGTTRFSASVPELLALLDTPADSCVLGLPLSVFSLRNLSLPFSDRKKMKQVLPLELEDQFPVPVDQQVIDFVVTGVQDGDSHVLVAAVEKGIIGELISVVKESGLMVRAVTLSVDALVRQYTRKAGEKQPILFLHADPHGMSMALWSEGRVVFMRWIAYLQQLFTRPVTGRKEIPLVVERETATKAMGNVCELVRNSLYYFQQESSKSMPPSRVVLSGCITDTGPWQSLIAHELDLPVEMAGTDRDFSGIRLSEQVQGQWNFCLYDGALALAENGLRKKAKSAGFNFLKGEFAPSSIRYFSRRSLLTATAALALVVVAGLGLLWSSYHRLNARATALHEEMTAIYKKTFPGVNRVDHPYLQMQSKLREVQGSEVSLPLFSGEKRALEILADISGRIPKNLSLHVSRLIIDQESVQMKGTTDAFNNVDVIKNKLAASSRYMTVKIVSAAADKKKGTIRFEIRLQLGEAS